MDTKTSKTLLVILFCLSGLQLLHAQDQLKHEKKYFINEDDQLIWNRHLPVYLRISSTPNDSGLLLKSEATKQYANPYFFDGEGYHRIRTDWATNQKTGEMVYPQVEVIWEVYADGIAPVSKLVFGKSTNYSGDENDFYGNDLQIEIHSHDAISGVAQIYYSINGETYKPYQAPISMRNSGVQRIKYYAVDNVGNVETPKEKSFVTDNIPPKTYYTVTGISNNQIIATTTKIYLNAEDSLSGVQSTFYKIDEGSFVPYKTNTSIPISLLDDGDHKLVFYSVDNVGNKEEETVFPFYLDKTAPIVAADILGDRYLMGDKIFFSGRSKMKLTAIDNKSGVEDLFYSVNGEKFKKYDQPFYLPNVPGIHIVRYYATDKMQNNSDAGASKYEQYKHVVSRIYVDLTGPILSHEIVGDQYKSRDTLFVSDRTLIKFKATDIESGLQYISYCINTEVDETKYTEPIQFKEPGLKHVVFYGYDNVNNRNRDEFSVYVDNQGPEIKYNFNITSKGIKDSLLVYPSHVVLFLAATDEIVGAKEIFYSLNNAPEQKYILSITGFKKASVNEVKIRAVDYLNNSSTLLLKVYIE